MPVGENPQLILPEDFDNYAWEVEAKGVFWDAGMRYEGREYRLTFYEIQRLAQDVTDQLEESPLFFERNLIVVRKITWESMELAVQELVRGRGIEGLSLD